MAWSVLAYHVKTVHEFKNCQKVGGPVSPPVSEIRASKERQSTPSFGNEKIKFWKEKMRMKGFEARS